MRSYISSFRLWLLGCVGIAVGLFALGLVATEVLIRSRIDVVDVFEQHVALYHHATTSNAAFGDSIVADGFLPETPDFINLATGGETPSGTLVKLRSFYDLHPPGRVLLGANHRILRRVTDHPDDYEQIFAERSRPLLRVMEQRHRHYALRYWHSLALGRLVPKRVTLPFGGEIFIDPARDRQFADLPAETRKLAAQRRALKELPKIDEQAEINKGYFVDMLRFLAERHMDVCAVTFPMSPSFREAAREIPGYAEARAWFRETVLESGATYVDLWDFVDDDAYFWDPTHLGEAGGRMVTAEIMARCFQDRSTEAKAE